MKARTRSRLRSQWSEFWRHAGDARDKLSAWWREGEERLSISLGTLIAVLVILAALASTVSTIRSVHVLIVLMLWHGAALLLAVMASQLIAGERLKQRLAPLLATPLSGRDIILNKMRGLHPILWIVGGVLVTLEIGEFGWRVLFAMQVEDTAKAAANAGLSLLTVFVYLPLVGWVSFWIGLRARTPSRGVIVALLVVVGVNYLPLPLVSQAGLGDVLSVVIPMTTVLSIELHNLDWTGMLWRMGGNLLPFGSLLLGLRWYCLSRADALLGRAGGPEPGLDGFFGAAREKREEREQRESAAV